MAPPVPVSANQGDAQRPREPSTLYKLIMTPIIFISFLLSLALVDLHHSAVRAHYHADAGHQPGTGGRLLPGWLHRIMYRCRPYRYDAVVVDGGGGGGGDGHQDGAPASPGSPGSVGSGSSGTVREEEDYYHSKQRKLMRMEAEEAFEMRGVVVVVLGLVSLGVLWAVWRVVGWAIGAVAALI